MVEPNGINQENSGQSPEASNQIQPEVAPLIESQAAITDNVAQETPVVPVLQPQAPVQTTSAIDDNLSTDDKNEIVEEFSGDVDSATTSWTKKAKDVIEEFETQPYQEEEKSEELQVDYMKQRFGVDIKKDKSN